MGNERGATAKKKGRVARCAAGSVGHSDVAVGGRTGAAVALWLKASFVFPPVVVSLPAVRRWRRRLLVAATAFAAAFPRKGSALGMEGNITIAPSSLAPSASPSASVVVSDPITELGQTLFHLAHQGGNDAALQRAMGRALRLAAPGTLTYVAPHLRVSPSSSTVSPSSLSSMSSAVAGPLKVGVASNYLHDHSIGKMMAGVLKGIAGAGVIPHDRGGLGGGEVEGGDEGRQPLFEVYIIDQVPHIDTKAGASSSSHSRDDDVHGYFVAYIAGGRHLCLAGLSLEGALGAVAALRLDVLFYVSWLVRTCVRL